MDRNRDGIIEASELHNVLKTALRTRKNTTDRQIRRLIESLDKDGDGRVDLDDISLLKDKIIVSFFFFFFFFFFFPAARHLAGAAVRCFLCVLSVMWRWVCCPLAESVHVVKKCNLPTAWRVARASCAWRVRVRVRGVCGSSAGDDTECTSPHSWLFVLLLARSPLNGWMNE